jgi:acyl-CoA hydrolase
MTPLTPAEAAARLHPRDTLGLPLGPGQPPAFLQALGERTDWEDLRISSALLTVLTPLFEHPAVHYLSGFFGPLERYLRDADANLGFAAADFRRTGPLLRRASPRVMATSASPPDRDGWCSLSLHSGGTTDELARAGADPDRLLVVEVSEHFPRTRGRGEHRHALHVDEIDVLVHSDAQPVALPDVPASEIDRQIALHAASFVPDGATIQTGIGGIPSAIAAHLASSPGGGYGVHSEMFTDGLMQLHRAGKVTNATKGLYDGVSVTTFAMGSAELYRWLHDNDDVAFLPVQLVNAPHVIEQNNLMTTINGALAVDIHGQVVADTLGGSQYSGIGGAEDFTSGPGFKEEQRALLCLPSTVTVGGELRSRILPWFEAGTVITTPRHQVDVIVTEYGAAELEAKTVRGRGEALAAVAHPAFRDELLEAADRASHGRSPLPPR